MSRGINRVTLIGNLGADPESRSTTSGGQIVTFSLATSEEWKDKDTGEKKERTEWHRIKVFGKLADICAQYLRKGSQVYIEGSIRTDKFTGKDGVEKYFTDIIARDMQMLGGREQGDKRESSGPRAASLPTPQPGDPGELDDGSDLPF